MAMTQLQKLELNKRVDKIFHAPSNVPAGNHQPEIAFVTPMSGNLELVQSSIKDAVASLKAHDKMFQNMRSNMVYWGREQITSKVTPMSFILMGRSLDSALALDSEIVGNLDTNVDKMAKQQRTPFLKYRLLIITKDKMMTGSELMMRLIR